MQTACQGKLGKMPRNLMEMNALKKIEELSPLMASKQQEGNVGSILLCLGLRKYSLNLAYRRQHSSILISLSCSICMSSVVVVLIHWSYRESVLSSYNYSCVNRVEGVLSLF